MSRNLRCILLVLLSLLAVQPLLAQAHWLEQLRQASDQQSDPEHHQKCAFPLVLEAMSSNGNPEMRAILENRPLRKSPAITYTSPTGQFIIHYDTSGVDAVPDYDRNNNDLPDYIEFMAEAYDRAWQVEIDSLGFNPPPDDDGADLESYDIFCERLPTGVYGLTDFTGRLDIATRPGLNFASTIFMNTDYSFILYPDITFDPIVRDSLAIAVTAAHEFNHALQLGYRLWEENGSFSDFRLIESSATYMEEVVAGEVNDYYQYLPGFFNRTTLNIANLSVLYGDVIFHIMNGDLYGKTITREIWTAILNAPGLDAMDAVFLQKGSSLADEWRRLGTWMFFCGVNAIPGQFFADAMLYPTPQIFETDMLDGNATTISEVFNGTLAPMAFQYFRTTVSPPGAVSMNVLVTENVNDIYGVSFEFSEPYVSEAMANTFAPAGGGSSLNQLFSMVFSGNWEGTANSRTDFILGLRATGGEVNVYPNPVTPNAVPQRVVFENLDVDARVEIFTANGLHVATVRPEGGRASAFWDLKNVSGDDVGSGIYIYQIVPSNDNKPGKVMVIR